MKNFILGLLITIVSIGFYSCEDADDIAANEPSLIIKFKFDENQVRLNNIGQPAGVLSGNAAQSPLFNTISSHYIELAPNANTALGQGTILYHAPETTLGGANAIDFSQAKIYAEGETFLKIPLSQIVSGSYEWVRVSLSYQNYDIVIRQDNVDYTGTLASFVGFNTYIGTHYIGNSTFPVNANKAQGYWALNVQGIPFSGQAPAGATTVPNPIASTSPIPAGSCVVTGKFTNNLVIAGNETQDIEMTLSLSNNNSFEWREINADGKYEPAAGENVVDMGLRGLIPSYQ
ncbi:hypothetical protein [Flavobacterium sp. GT3R68]|uniref:hypothetical protein n=1 Tax=Flavobacterium sp. GT3R68 TaxID=2594437 RepID=UPI000F895444|nr:hypothetical protein [Flavobacterium sp. GT3R68]RTY95763.1 hypothetical protein EKL32_03725 [Flavobacterium sp. GSN2]TRW93534.1 hypothetical protein FNW07_01115 [Flavobacterium sp. GT3R68]